jgi:hypothetical protein
MREHGPTYDPWRLDQAVFPSDGPWTEQAKFFVRYAALAPSGHNTQPWRFRVVGEVIELRADRSRSLPVVDPEDRELTISCGAALFHLRIAMRHFGWTEHVQTLPDANDPDLLARIRPATRHTPVPEEERLFEAIPRRHTNRLEFDDRPVPDALMDALRDAVVVEGARFVPLVDLDERKELAELIAEGDRIQAADPAFRHELARWLHPNRTHSGDGMPGYAFGHGDLASYVGPILVRSFDWGNGQAAADRALAECSPALAIIGTDEDNPLDWLCVGQALDRMLLRACSENLSASYLNQPVEVPALRARLGERWPLAGRPQLVLRLGYGPPVPGTPRRPLRDIID